MAYSPLRGRKSAVRAEANPLPEENHSYGRVGAGVRGTDRSAWICDVLVVTCSCLGRKAVPGGKVASTGLLSSVLSDQSTVRPTSSRSTRTARHESR